MLCIAKNFESFRAFKNSDEANPFGTLMKKYSWTILLKTVLLIVYFFGVNFSNCPLTGHEPCDAATTYNGLFLVMFGLITRMTEGICACTISIQEQERDANPVPISVEEPQTNESTCNISLKIAVWTGRIVAVVGIICVLKGLYKGFNARSIAIRKLGISADADYVTRDQYAMTDNIRVISFL